MMFAEHLYENGTDMMICSDVLISNRRHEKFCAIRKRQLRTLRTIVRLC